MDEHGASAAGDPRARIVVKLDDEIIEMIVARKTVARGAGREADVPVVAPVGRVFAPSVLGADAADGEQGPRPRPAIGAPPQSLEAKPSGRGGAVALALVGFDAAAPKRDRKPKGAGGEPAVRSVAGSRAHVQHLQRDGPGLVSRALPQAANPRQFSPHRLLF